MGNIVLCKVFECIALDCVSICADDMCLVSSKEWAHGRPTSLHKGRDLEEFTQCPAHHVGLHNGGF